MNDRFKITVLETLKDISIALDNISSPTGHTCIPRMYKTPIIEKLIKLNNIVFWGEDE